MRETGDSRTWRLLRHCIGGAALNMAVDEAMLRALIVDQIPPTLRLYQWEGFAVSVGRFQSIERTMHLDRAAENQVQLVRRVTGGRGILHGDDLTISIACRCADLGVGSEVNLARVYTEITGILRQAFVGISIEVVQGAAARCQPRSNCGDCFATISPADLVHRGSGVKLLGGALHRYGEFVLYQASLPLRTAHISKRVHHYASTIFSGDNALIHRSNLNPISREDFENSIVTALCQQLQIEVAGGEQTVFEIQAAEVLQEARYNNSDWTIYGRSINDLAPN